MHGSSSRKPYATQGVNGFDDDWMGMPQSGAGHFGEGQNLSCIFRYLNTGSFSP